MSDDFRVRGLAPRPAAPGGLRRQLADPDLDQVSVFVDEAQRGWTDLQGSAVPLDISTDNRTSANRRCVAAHR